MRLLTVVPITKGFLGEELTYFSKDDVAAGAIVEVPLGRKTAKALVTESKDLTAEKAAIRQGAFSLKKINRLINPQLYSAAFLAAAHRAADYYGSGLGPVIKNFTPQIILEQASANKKAVDELANNLKPRLKNEAFVLQEPEVGRLGFYKSLIRESFAKKTSVFFLLPGQNEIDEMSPELARGIERYTFALHGQLSRKELLEKWQDLNEERHPVLILATPLFLSLPRSDLKTIIIERETSDGYKSLSRPYADGRKMAELLAAESGAKLIIGDLLLRAETIFRAERGELLPASPLKYRAVAELEQKIFDAREDTKDGVRDGSPIGRRLAEELQAAATAGQKIFLLSHRRGLSPVTVCQDCGTLKACPICEAPLVLHQSKKSASENFFLCHRCGAGEKNLDACRECGGWRLITLGGGIEKVESWLNKNLPKIPLFRLDSDSTTPREARLLVQQFMKVKSGILLGTEMALYYLHDKVDMVAAAHLDSLLSLPDFRGHEKIMTLLLRARGLARKKFFLETRSPDEKIYQLFLAGNLLDFVREEINERKQLNWPPFSTLLKVWLLGPKPALVDQLKKTAKSLLDPKINMHTMVTPSDKPRYFKGIIIMELPAGYWPEPTLLAKLRALPPNWQVEVDPTNLF